MNYPQQSAQGLASLGRGNDSMLVHMTPNEVQGLQGLAMAHGGSLSINPQTGLPEAGFLDFVLPVAGSFLGMPPWLTASLMAGKTLIEGGDLGDAVMSGLTSYGGAKLGEGLKTFVDPIKQSTTAALNAANTAGSFVGSTGEMGSKLLSPSGGAQAIGSGAGSVADSLKSSFTPDFAKGFTENNLQGSFMGKDVGAQGMFQPGGANTLQTTGAPTYGPNVGAAADSNMLSGITDQASKFPDQFGAAVKNPVDFARHIGEGDALLGGAKIGMYGASPFLEGMLQPEEYTGYSDPEKGKWTSDTGGLSFNPKYSTGLRLLPNLNQPIRAARGGYINKYANGGVVSNPSVGSGISDLYNRPEGQTSESISNDGYGIGRLNNLAGEQSKYQAQTLGYADGGDISNYRQDQAPLNLKLAGGPSEDQSSSGNFMVDSRGPGYNVPAFALSFRGLGGSLGTTAIPTPAPNQLGMYGTNSPLLGILQQISAPKPEPKAYALNLNTGKQEAQYARGGYLNGAGDGMSDSIPATIEGKQPARLADGEFVIPADVVSHLGNGSSKAGSKRLYAMLDKVRHARTGNKKQGKEIKAEKYLPKVA
jgi:hypothetical protein